MFSRLATFLPLAVLAFHTIQAHGQTTESPSPPDYRIEAVHFATLPNFPARTLLAGAEPDERIDVAMIVWLIRGEDRVILYDTGFHREVWFDYFDIIDYVRPDHALESIGVAPGHVTDIIISHTHWDHIGGIDLFPNATIWIQEEEFSYYTGPAWQDGNSTGPIDPEDMIHLVRRNMEGDVRLIQGDDVEIIPGITVYIGGRHTYASQFVRVAGEPVFVLASDNAYYYRNLLETMPIAITFGPGDDDANLKSQSRMLEMAGSWRRVIPGHDPKQFELFSTHARVARIR